MKYQINQGWSYKNNGTSANVIDQNGVESEVEFKAIDILDAIKNGNTSLEAIIKYTESCGVNLTNFTTQIRKASSDEIEFSEGNFQQDRIKGILEDLLEIGVISIITQ